MSSFTQTDYPDQRPPVADPGQPTRSLAASQHPNKVAQAASLSPKKVAQAASLSPINQKNRQEATCATVENNRQIAGATLGNNSQAAVATLPDSGYFNPYVQMASSLRNLPHWRQDGVWYFVTYRLADSLPQSVMAALVVEREQWLAANPESRSDAQMEEYWDRFGGRLNELLDAGSGACWLRRSDVRDIVVESLQYNEGKRYQLDAWVAMPNHVHALVKPLNAIDLSKILHTWKSYTANQINQLLQRTGTFWQDESYDHLVRSPSAFYKIREYILTNPAKAMLQPDEYSVACLTQNSPGGQPVANPPNPK